MPHIGEKTRIYFPTDKESNAITMSSTRGSKGEMATTKTLNKPTEKSLDTKWGKQISLKEGSAELSSALMSVKLDEENIEIVSNQTIDISAGEELNIGKSIFISKDKDGNEIVTIEETKNISIETEELNTLSVTTTGTVIELDKDSFIHPLSNILMEGSVKASFPMIVSDGQKEGDAAAEEAKAAEAAKKQAEEEQRQQELAEREELGKKQKKKGFGSIALGFVAVAVGVVGVCVSAPILLAATGIGAVVVGMI